MTDDRIKDLENKLSRWVSALADETDEHLCEWIVENKITRDEAQQIAKFDGHFLQERLQLLLDRELGDDEAIFEDDEVRETKE